MLITNDDMIGPQNSAIGSFPTGAHGLETSFSDCCAPLMGCAITSKLQSTAMGLSRPGASIASASAQSFCPVPACNSCDDSVQPMRLQLCWPAKAEPKAGIISDDDGGGAWIMRLDAATVRPRISRAYPWRQAFCYPPFKPSYTSAKRVTVHRRCVGSCYSTQHAVWRGPILKSSQSR